MRRRFEMIESKRAMGGGYLVPPEGQGSQFVFNNIYGDIRIKDNVKIVVDFGVLTDPSGGVANPGPNEMGKEMEFFMGYGDTEFDVYTTKTPFGQPVQATHNYSNGGVDNICWLQVGDSYKIEVWKNDGGYRVAYVKNEQVVKEEAINEKSMLGLIFPSSFGFRAYFMGTGEGGSDELYMPFDNFHVRIEER